MFSNLKKNFTLACTLVLALVFVGTSCKKDDDKSLNDLIQAHSWKLTGEKNGSTPVGIDPCSADDIYDFEDNGVFHFDEGATKCDESDPQEDTGTWSISESTTPATLTWSDGSTTLEWKITTLDKNTMVLLIENVPILETIEFTFEKK